MKAIAQNLQVHTFYTQKGCSPVENIYIFKQSNKTDISETLMNRRIEKEKSLIGFANNNNLDGLRYSVGKAIMNECIPGM